MAPKTRKHKGSANRQLRFSNNTKKSNNTNTRTNYSKLPLTYLEELQEYIPEPNPIHTENAHVFAKVSAYHNTPEKMAKNLYYIYYPQPLTTSDFTFLIDCVGDFSKSESQKERILKYLQYKRAITKVRKLYGNSDTKNDVNPHS